MAYVNSLKYIWEKADSSYNQTIKPGVRAPINRRHFSGFTNEKNEPKKEMENESEDGSSQKSFENFDAIPEEFRPRQKGKDLLKVRTFPEKFDGKKAMNKEEQFQNKRSPYKRNESLRQQDIMTSDSAVTSNLNRNCQKESVVKQLQNKDRISDETEKQKFFYDSFSRNVTSIKSTSGRQQNCSRRINNRSTSSENNCQTKETNEFHLDKDGNTYSKSKAPLSNFREETANNENKGFYREQNVKKVTRQTTVTKRIQWKNDICSFKKPENKPNFYYEFAKTTKQSVNRVILDSEDDDEATKKSNLGFKKESIVCHDFYPSDIKNNKGFDSTKKFQTRTRVYRDNFHRSGAKHNNREFNLRAGNRNQKEFDSTNKYKRKEAKNVNTEEPGQSIHKCEESPNYISCCKTENPVIIKHEIKIFHFNGNGRGKNNQMHRNSFQRFQPPKKGRNDKNDMANDKHGNGAMMDKAAQKTGKNYADPSLTSFKTEFANCNLSPPSNKVSEENAATLINYGREVSDLIAGSHLALNIFLDNYEQWKDYRRLTMLLFEEFEKNLSQMCNKSSRIVEVSAMVGNGCKMVQYVPHPGVSVAAKVIAILSDIVSKFFSTSQTVPKDNFQLKLCLQNDMEATSDIYGYGLQCDVQFQETCKIIEELHSKIQDGLFDNFIETFETGFLKEISRLNPKHADVFYKRLERFYKLLNSCCQSEEGKAFCEAFEDWPDALATISHLPRRFKTESWDSSSVLQAWVELCNLLQNDQSKVEDVLNKVQNCICVLNREKIAMEKYVIGLRRRI